MPFLPPNQQRQSTEGNLEHLLVNSDKDNVYKVFDFFFVDCNFKKLFKVKFFA